MGYMYHATFVPRRDMVAKKDASLQLIYSKIKKPAGKIKSK